MASNRRGRSDGGCLSSSRLFLFLFLFAGSVLALRLAAVATEESRRQYPNAAERAMTATGSAWESFWSSIALGAMNLRPGISRSRSGTIREAAARSFQVGKSAGEESARSAARVAETVVEKAAEKVKRAASHAIAGGDEGGDL